MAPVDKYFEVLQGMGFTCVPINLDRKGMNVFHELFSLWQIFRLYKSHKPALVHHYTVKCVAYGSIAAWFLGIKVVNSITGLGHIFINQNSRAKFARFIVTHVYLFFAKRSFFLFQNSSDRNFFLGLGIATEDKAFLVQGSGVDCAHFQALVEYPTSEALCVFYAGRLLREKGLCELVEAILILRNKGKNIILRCAGSLGDGNPSAISMEQVRVWENSGAFFYLGHLDSIDEELARCDLVALTSWREGFPKFLLEAAAAGKAILSTDVAGCNELIENEVSGLLVPVRDAEKIADALLRLFEPNLRKSLGNAARERSKLFDKEIIHRKTIQVYERLLSQD